MTRRGGSLQALASAVAASAPASMPHLYNTCVFLHSPVCFVCPNLSLCLSRNEL